MKKTVAVLFGGQSSEHDISCISVQTVIAHMNMEKYNPVLIGITKQGEWLKVSKAEEIKDRSWYKSRTGACILPDAGEKSLIFFEKEKKPDSETCQKEEKIKIDLAFPVLHGLRGEDGTIQGLFELAGIPYVGCGVLASAVSMDKLYTKIIADTLGIRQAAYVAVLREELKDMDRVVQKVEEKLSYPVFVKPSNAGSSVGVSKAEDKEQLKAALLLANENDRKILVEETIIGREIECAVLGKAGDVDATGVGEIFSGADFYDYEAKYHSSESRTVLDPELPEGKAEEIADCAKRIFTAVDGFGLSRVDFFLTGDTNEVVFNEINTMPGFTGISMYPLLWERKGLSREDLVEKLMELALER